jgi:hypothetical protein
MIQGERLPELDSQSSMLRTVKEDRMPSSLFCTERLESTSYSRQSRYVYRRTLVALSLLLICSTFGCTGSQSTKNANSAAAAAKQPANGNANAESRATSSQPSHIDIKEPERYSAAITISAQDIAGGAPASMATQQFGFAKLGADRRWAFNFPEPLGQVAYLEKSGLKYLVLFDHKQYAELTPDLLPFSMTTLSPGAIAEHLRPRMQFEKSDAEPLNGRAVLKYRVASSHDDSTESDGAIFVDSETGLPLRSDFNTSPQAGTRTRVIVEARDLQLNPDRSQFDVPAGMKKITTQEAKQQIGEFVSRLHVFADIVSGSRPASVAVSDKAVTNSNHQVRRVRPRK